MFPSLSRCRRLHCGLDTYGCFQACRGDKFDAGAEAYDEVDGSLEFKCVRVPIEADCLYAYSTVPGM